MKYFKIVNNDGSIESIWASHNGYERLLYQNKDIEDSFSYDMFLKWEKPQDHGMVPLETSNKRSALHEITEQEAIELSFIESV